MVFHAARRMETVQVPDGWLQPSAIEESPAKARRSSQVTLQPEANRRGPLPEEVSVVRARAAKLETAVASGRFRAFTRGTEDSEGPVPSPPVEDRIVSTKDFIERARKRSLR